MSWTKEQMLKRVIRYDNLIPCKNAFVDTRTPGSDQKENFTLIGPGVSENPNQHIHIPEAHGFNIGGARQPPGCLNSQHSHISAEVFVAHSGHWKMNFGVNADEGSVELYPGDTISIPTHMYRGFENIGKETGFLFAVLGRDNPGKVTWAPQVFELAKKYGLILLKGGKLIDTTVGEKVPDGVEIETPPTAEEIAALATPAVEKLAGCVAKMTDLTSNPLSTLSTASDGVSEAGIITPFKSEDGFEGQGIVPWWEHEFHLRLVTIAPNGKTSLHSRLEEEVVFIHTGSLTVEWENESLELKLELNTGDTMTIPKGLARRFSNSTTQPMQAFVVRGGKCPTGLVLTA